MNNASTYTSINGAIVTAENATISVQDRGLRFGDGIFETIRLIAGIPYQWETHLERLTDGLEALRIESDTQHLITDALALIRKNEVSDGILRIMITRGEGSIGYLPSSQCVPNIIIETIGKNFPPISPAHLWLSTYRKPSALSLPPKIKHMQGLNSTLAKIEAQEKFCDEALLLDDKEQICEATSGNIFWVKNGNIFTPSVLCPMVAGTMRKAILRLSPYTIEEGEYSLGDLKDADEIFLSNASWPIMPVSKISPLEYSYSNHSIAHELLALIKEDMQHYVDAWQPPVA